MSDTKWQPTQKSRRCYHRVISGIERGGVLRFLTLTSSNQSPDTIQRSFRALYMRLRRRGLIRGYIKIPEPSKNGKQHLHVLFRGSYLEQVLISQWWQEIHQAKIIDVRQVKYGSNKKRLASYLAKYMSKENMYRYSWNWDWVWRGFVNDWTALKRWWRQYNELFKPHSFNWLLTQWHLCLVNDLRPILFPLPHPP